MILVYRYFKKINSKGVLVDCSEKTNLVFPTVQLLITTIEEILKENPMLVDNNLVNLHYTLANCAGDSKKFDSQDIIAFDIDSNTAENIVVDLNRINDYFASFCRVTGLDSSKIAVVSSGHGIHFLVQTDAWYGEEYFDKYKNNYAYLCSLIQSDMEMNGLPGKFDIGIFSPNHTLRLPGTINRKEGRPDTECKLIYSNLSYQEFKLSDFAAPDDFQITPGKKAHKAKNIPKDKACIDVDFIKENCAFLKRCYSDPSKVTELEWYAGMSLVARFPNAEEEIHNFSKGHPTYDRDKTIIKAQQALNASGPRTCDNIATLNFDCGECPHKDKIITPLQLKSKKFIATEKTGFYNLVVKQNGSISYVPDFESLRNKYDKDFNYMTIIEQKSTWVWESPIWKPVFDIEVFNYAYNMFDPRPSMHIRREFYDLVSCTNLEHSEFFNDRNSNLINLKNGVLNVSTKEFTPHDKNHGFTYVLPYDYDENADCPKFKKFLAEIMQNDSASATLLVEFMGYCLSGIHPKYMSKFMFLSGTGANGKSTFLSILTALLGEANTAHVKLEQLSDPQSRFNLIGKLANLCTEIPDRNSKFDVNLLKQMVSGEDIEVKKLYTNSFFFQPRAKHIFACNSLPFMNDTTHGLYRRLLIVPFNRQFSAAEEIKGLDDMIIAEELPGILNYAVDAWRNAWDKKSFTIESKVVEATNDFKSNTNSITFWFDSNVTIIPDEQLAPLNDLSDKALTPKYLYPLVEVYKSYKAFCDDLELQCQSYLTFSKSLRTLVSNRTIERFGEIRLSGGKKFRYIYGISYSDAAVGIDGKDIL